MNRDDIFVVIGAALALLLVFVAIIGVPFAQIWAVNTLFSTKIEYSLINWLAVFVLNGTFKAASYNYEKKK